MFNADGLVQKGNIAEMVVYSFLLSQDHITNVVDVTKNREYQDVEIDFTFDVGSLLYGVEVKYDKHIGNTKNVIFELTRIHLTSQNHCAYLGWSVFSEADYIAVWCEPTQELYMIQTVKLRKAFQRYATAAKKSMQLRTIISDDTRLTINVLIPLSYVRYRKFIIEGGHWNEA